MSVTSRAVNVNVTDVVATNDIHQYQLGEYLVWMPFKSTHIPHISSHNLP
jgi:hypothetical protein